MMRFALDLLTPDRMNAVGIGVYGGTIVPSWGFPPEWLEAAKGYWPGVSPDLSVLAWMLAVNDGKVRAGDHIPLWVMGRVEEARALVARAEANR